MPVQGKFGLFSFFHFWVHSSSMTYSNKQLRYLILFYRYETSRMESLLQRYEQRVFDLEESEVDLRERLTGAQGSLGSLIYWSFVVLTSGGVRPKLPKLAIGTSAAAHYIPTSDQSNSIDPK